MLIINVVVNFNVGIILLVTLVYFHMSVVN